MYLFVMLLMKFSLFPATILFKHKCKIKVLADLQAFSYLWSLNVGTHVKPEFFIFFHFSSETMQKHFKK